MNAPWFYSRYQPTVGSRKWKEQIAWPSPGANNCNPCPSLLTRKPKPKQSKMPMEKGQWRLYNASTDPINHLARPEQTTIFRLLTGHWPVSAPEVNWHHGLCTMQLQRSTTDGPLHPPGLSHLTTPAMAAGWVNHQQAVANGGRPAPHHPISGNMWTEGLSMTDRPQKKKSIYTFQICICSHFNEQLSSSSRLQIRFLLYVLLNMYFSLFNKHLRLSSKLQVTFLLHIYILNLNLNPRQI